MEQGHGEYSMDGMMLQRVLRKHITPSFGAFFPLGALHQYGRTMPDYVPTNEEDDETIPWDLDRDGDLGNYDYDWS